MSRYAYINKNDVTNGQGICVSFWVQGCNNHCKGCHNESIWDYNGGYPFTLETVEEILCALNEHGVRRNFSILGGEPLCVENIPMVAFCVKAVREKYPNITISIWTGYYLEQLMIEAQNNKDLMYILSEIDYLIDGPYEEDKRDITLKLRGSSNQNIIYMGDKDAREFRQNKII